MDIIDSASKDVVFLNTTSSLVQGEVTGVIAKDGRIYTVIDHKVAVKQQTSIDKVKSFASKYLWGCLFIASFVGGLGATLIGLVVEREAYALFGAVSMLASLVFAGKAVIDVGGSKRPPPEITLDEVIKARQSVESEGIVSLTKKAAQVHKSQIHLAFSDDEYQSLLIKDSANYSFTQLLNRIGTERTFKFLPKEIIEKKIEEEGFEDVPASDVRNVMKILDFYERVGDRRMMKVLGKLQDNGIKGFEEESSPIAQVIKWAAAFLERNKRVRVIPIPMPMHAPLR